ncbi:RNA polymerase sigma factor RpoD/SigA [Mucilaginibacter sp. L196]|uniref:sigma-70 family RNA polymerase sigma factor n=1 Tax=Mucilaginibacter sp. L196 TaxID=1641870 RepID=UPI00131C573D|nr:RNA polymerase sigma factor RpoD/SigA [Mucilaginibacter sp. L196]
MRSLQITQSITNRETQVLESYFKEVGKLELITAEEEVLLAQKIKQGDQDALERLTKTNLRFVVSVAKKYQHLGLPLSDLISEGNLGLVKAAKRFDETRGFKFVSFAVWWIRQSILLAIAEHTRMVRLPLNQINLLTKMNRFSGDLENLLERQPTDKELAEMMGIPMEKIGDARYHSARTSSYDAPYNIDDEYTLINKLADPDSTIDHILIEQSEYQNISGLLDALSSRERKVIELSFGLSSDWPLPIADIANQMGLTSERIRQIKVDAITKLKARAAKMELRYSY